MICKSSFRTIFWSLSFCKTFFLQIVAAEILTLFVDEEREKRKIETDARQETNSKFQFKMFDPMTRMYLARGPPYIIIIITIDIVIIIIIILIIIM